MAGCDKILPDCAREFGEIRQDLKHQAAILERIEAKVDSLCNWQAQQKGQETASRRWGSWLWNVITVIVAVISSLITTFFIRGDSPRSILP